jgi:glycosyltransferase involved in cell wall biosynthesis
MKISIHMPARNAEATIGSALKSLLRQRDAGRLDIIVVDDGSVDGTSDAVRTLAAAAPEIRLLRVPHGGVSRARNVALQAMAPDTDLVGFLDADDLSPDGRLARDVAAFATDSTLDLIYAKARLFDHEDTEKLAPSLSSRTVDGRIISMAVGLFRRPLLDRVGLFDETLIQAEDMDYLLRTFELEPKYLISDDVSLFYRQHQGSATGNRRQLRHEFMKALLRAKKRGGKATLPEGVVTVDHVVELRSWGR